MLKDYLSSKGIPFAEKMVDTDEVVKEEMIKASGGFLGVPFTVVTKDDGTNENVIGFDKGKLDSIFGSN